MMLEMPFIWDNETVFLLFFYLHMIVLCCFIWVDRKERPYLFVLTTLIMIILIMVQFYVITGPRFQFVLVMLLFSMIFRREERKQQGAGPVHFLRPPTKVQGVGSYPQFSPSYHELDAPCTPFSKVIR